MATATHDLTATYSQPIYIQPDKTPEYQALERFCGTWKTVGKRSRSPIGPAGNVSALERYEWLSGNRFLMHRFDGQVGEEENSFSEVIGYDAESQSYPVHSYYEDGISTESRYWERGITWILIGTVPSGKATRVRCTVVFNSAGDRMTSRWEYSKGDVDWTTFSELDSKRLK